MKPLTYTLANPAGNITVLVETPVPVCAQPKAAAFLMKKESLAEQVGFVTNTALRMAGGEFCGNATASAAALYCRKNNLQTADLSVTVCGLDYPVSVALQGEHYNTCVTLPPPQKITAERLCVNGTAVLLPCVWMDGIAHLIVETDMEKALAEQAVQQWAAQLRVDALGLMFLSAENRLDPLVFVPGANTLHWENSCASGTAAVTAYLHATKKTDKVVLRQPGGVLQAETAEEDAILLAGTVMLSEPRTALWEG